MDPSVAELMTDILPPNTTLNAVPSPVEIFGSLESGFDSNFSGLTGGSVTNNGGSNQGGCGFEEVFTFSSATDVTASFPLDNGSSGLPGNANPVKSSLEELDGEVTPTSSLAHTPSSTYLSLNPREQCGCGVEGHCPLLQCPNMIYIDDGDVMDMPFVSMSKMAARSSGSKSKKASLSAGAWMLRVGRKPKTIMKKAKIRGLNRSPEDIRASDNVSTVEDAVLLLLQPKKFRKTARFEEAIPSRFCHVCSRKAENIRVFVCSNIAQGTCRKVTCEKCYVEHGFEGFEGAAEGSSMKCLHCYGTCPERAQCRTYGRVNDRLRAKRLRNPKQARKAPVKEKVAGVEPSGTAASHSPIVTKLPLHASQAQLRTVSDLGQPVASIPVLGMAAMSNAFKSSKTPAARRQHTNRDPRTSASQAFIAIARSIPTIAYQALPSFAAEIGGHFPNCRAHGSPAATSALDVDNQFAFPLLCETGDNLSFASRALMATVPSTMAKHLPSLTNAFHAGQLRVPAPLPPIDSLFPSFGDAPAEADYPPPGTSGDEDMMRYINWD
jgi:hypothetical protein